MVSQLLFFDFSTRSGSYYRSTYSLFYVTWRFIVDLYLIVGSICRSYPSTFCLSPELLSLPCSSDASPPRSEAERCRPSGYLDQGMIWKRKKTIKVQIWDITNTLDSSCWDLELPHTPSVLFNVWKIVWKN